MSSDPRKAIPVPAAYIRSVLRRFGRTPEERAGILAGTDFDEVRLREAGEVTLFTSVVAVQNVCRLIGEDWPLHAMEAWDSAMQGALEVAARSAPTVRDSVEVMTRFGQVRGPQFQLRLVKEQSRVAIAIAPSMTMPEMAWHSFVVTAMLSVGAMLRSILQGDTAGVVFECSWPKPSYAEQLSVALPGAVRFARPMNTIVIPIELCERASPFADPPLFATAIAELERAVGRISGKRALPLRVEQLLRTHKGRLSADQAARLLGMSRRTLVRRLSECGVSYRALLDAAMKQRAQELMVERKLSRTQVAEELGFADPASFSRARRRWSDQET